MSWMPIVVSYQRIDHWDDQQVLREIVPPDTGLAFAAMWELRTHLTSLEDFIEQVDNVQRPAGYTLVGVLPDHGTKAVDIAGFRLSTSLSWGRHVYIVVAASLAYQLGLLRPG